MSVKYGIRSMTALIVVALLLPGFTDPVFAQTQTASWYSRESCAREGTGGADIRMANGRRLQDDQLTFASWDYRFGQVCRITNTDTGKSITAVCTDRGPNRKLYRKGRVADLSMAAFAKLAPLSQGVIRINIEAIHD